MKDLTTAALSTLWDTEELVELLELIEGRTIAEEDFSQKLKAFQKEITKFININLKQETNVKPL
jgi:hypothetical protein